jgi:hypothetical protein
MSFETPDFISKIAAMIFNKTLGIEVLHTLLPHRLASTEFSLGYLL